MFKRHAAYYGFVLALLILVTACSSTPSKAPASSPSEPATSAVTDHESPAERVLSLYEGEDMSAEDKATNMLAHLEGMDWTEYNRLSSGKTLETLELLYTHRSLIQPEHYASLFLATTNLDGASAEQYAAIVGELFAKDREGVVQALADLGDEASRQSVISSIAYHLGYQDVAQVKQEIHQWQTNKVLHDAEKDVIASLIAALDNP
ncbi:hypothetical protein MHI43_02610 [Paenibacillus sp. FSL H8-0457]|uniref:hypothetical protein n=1 Tax=unclassified Paenibacillus TaxID=185978 RepID=UPI0003E29DD2|nr:hypothetical protein [Paenibacillus sp. FSL H8-457]ETT59894.1 hypothetical protein C172_23708 [Paenibacillus sp. FSL H8-457]